MMCESDNESENNSSAYIYVFEQRAYIKIETICGKTVPEIHAALNEVCGTDTVDRSTVQRWHQRFREGRKSIDNNSRSGRPSTVTQDNTNAVIHATLLDEDRRITVREIENETGKKLPKNCDQKSVKSDQECYKIVCPYCTIMRGRISEHQSSLFWRNMDGNALNTHCIRRI